MKVLTDAKGAIVSKAEIVPGIYEVKYQLPKGMNKAPETKTVLRSEDD